MSNLIDAGELGQGDDLSVVVQLFDTINDEVTGITSSNIDVETIDPDGNYTALTVTTDYTIAENGTSGTYRVVILEASFDELGVWHVRIRHDTTPNTFQSVIIRANVVDYAWEEFPGRFDYLALRLREFLRRNGIR